MKKKYTEILPHYRWLFVKGNIIIGEWGIFGVEIFLHYIQFFIKGNFVIGGVECIYLFKSVRSKEILKLPLGFLTIMNEFSHSVAVFLSSLEMIPYCSI